jgi:hypothetical protein
MSAISLSDASMLRNLKSSLAVLITNVDSPSGVRPVIVSVLNQLSILSDLSHDALYIHLRKLINPGFSNAHARLSKGAGFGSSGAFE